MEQEIFDELERSMTLSKGQRRSILRELRGHVKDAQLDLQLAGTPPNEAVRQSVARLGNPAEIGQEFVEAYKRPRRRHFAVSLALAGALLLGAFGAGASLASTPHPNAPHKPAIHAVSKSVSQSRSHAAAPKRSR